MIKIVYYLAKIGNASAPLVVVDFYYFSGGSAYTSPVDGSPYYTV